MMKKRLFWCLIVMGWAFTSLPGQLSSILPDSLSPPPQPDSSYYNKLLDFGDTYMVENPQKALAAYLRVGVLARPQEDHQYLSASFNGVAIVHLVTSQPDSALMALDSAMRYALIQSDSQQIYNLEVLNGVTYYEIGHYQRSLDANRKALRYFQQQENALQIARLANNIGNIYSHQEDDENALEHYHEALKAGEEADDNRLISGALNNLGNTFLGLDQLDSAEFYLERCYAFGLEKDFKFAHGELCSLLGTLRLAQGRLEEVEAYLQEGLAFARGIPAPATIGTLLLTQGDWQKEQGLIQQALLTYDSAAHYSVLGQALEQEIEAQKAIYQLRKEQGKAAQALQAFERVNLLRDSVYDLERTQRLEELVALHRSERKQQEIQQLTSERELQNRLLDQQNWLIAGLGLAFLSTLALLGFAFVSARRRRRDNQILQQQNERIDRQQQEIVRQNQALGRQNQHLETLNSEMEGLIEIVAHDLKSPISKTQAVVELIGEVKDPGELPLYVSMVRQILNGGMKLIQDILAIRRIEGQSEILDYQQIDLGALLEATRSSFEAAAREKQIALVYQTSSAPIYLKTVPGDLERILENLVSNAIKFSPPSTQVVLKVDKAGSRVEISIRDQGPGISSEDQSRMFQKFQRLSARPTGGESSTGLGLSIVKALVTRLGGSIAVESELGNGAEFKLHFPGEPGEIPSN